MKLDVWIIMCYKGYFIKYYNANLSKISKVLETFSQTKVYDKDEHQSLLELVNRKYFKGLQPNNIELSGRLIKKYLTR